LDPARPVLANLHGDYAYLGEGYYRSLDAELRGEQVIPSTRDALDAYVVPIALRRAALAGLDVPVAEIVTERFPPPPLLAYPINPFSVRGALLESVEAVATRRKGLTYTGKYAVLCQRLPPDHRIDTVRCVLGRSAVAEYAPLAAALFACFRVPLMKARVIVTHATYALSAIDPLPWRELTREERDTLEGLGTWHG
jgi:hypothetical protein